MKIEYHKLGDYYFPNLTVSKQAPIELTKYGRLKLHYLKQHHRIIYTNLLVSGELYDYLGAIDKQANKMYDRLLNDFKKQRHISEELKERDQMLWVQEMNNIDACINEIIYSEYIYN